MSRPPPPSPSHILRCHSTPITTLSLSDDNERLYSGDLSGQVTVTSTRSLRAISSWKAHSDGLLGIQEWNQYIITHGRDNKLHIRNRLEEFSPSESIRTGGSATLSDLPIPSVCFSMDVNALNYCRFSLLILAPCKNGDGQALIALPNLVESSLADIWELPSCSRIHAAIGKADLGPGFSFAGDGRGNITTGIIMSIHLFAADPSTSVSRAPSDQLRLLSGYENGSVTLRKFIRNDQQSSVNGIGWDVVWTTKLHVESVMAMTVSTDNTLALSVSADHLIGRYDLTNLSQMNASSRSVSYRTKHPGNAAITLRDDGKVCAVGGWDGKIRLYSTKTMKSLGTLDYHKIGCQAVTFAKSIQHVNSNGQSQDDEDEMTMEEKEERNRWVVGGGKDGRISIWTLTTFEKK